MKKEVRPSAIKGTITAPASKSVVQRAIAAALLSHGKSIITNPGSSNDCLAAISIARALGATVTVLPNSLEIIGTSGITSNHLHCGESGLSIRMFTPIAASFSEEISLMGEGSLTIRPMATMESPLQQLGAYCKTTHGLIPIVVKGPLHGGKAALDGSLGSQILTGLLMAAPRAKEDVTLQVKNLQSKPYIDLTLEVMKAFGVCADNYNYEEFFIKANQKYQPTTFNVEGDWSGAAFLLVAGAIAGRIRVENITTSSRQADKAIMQAIMQAGAIVNEKSNAIEVCHAPLSSFSFDATDCPDLFPPLVTLAAECGGVSSIKGVGRLEHKESNRSIALQAEYRKMGINIEVDGDTMLVTGGSISAATIDSHNDHRIAMATAISGLTANGTVFIEGAECVAKSYPAFFDDLNTICKLPI